MRSRVHAIVAPTDAIGEFSDELRQLFLELDRTGGLGLTGEFAPPLDVFETDETIEIVLDLPGVSPDAVRVIAKGQAVLAAGEKAPRRGHGDSSFHLVERGYGRFARAIRLARPCDTTRATAVLEDGELKISLPKLTDRRNHAIRIAIASRRDA